MALTAAFKQQVHRQCILLLEERVEQIHHNIHDMRAAAQEDSKSSAGDKHETGRAMTDLEIEKQQVSLSNTLQMLAVIKKIDAEKINEKAVNGALIETQKGIFYIAVALGKIKVDGKEVLVISPEAPLSLAFTKNNKVILNGNTFEITGIY